MNLMGMFNSWLVDLHDFSMISGPLLDGGNQYIYGFSNIREIASRFLALSSQFQPAGSWAGQLGIGFICLDFTPPHQKY